MSSIVEQIEKEIVIMEAGVVKECRMYHSDEYRRKVYQTLCITR